MLRAHVLGSLGAAALLVAAADCSLALTDKSSCSTSADCLTGRVCLNQVCAEASASGGATAGDSGSGAAGSSTQAGMGGVANGGVASGGVASGAAAGATLMAGLGGAGASGVAGMAAQGGAQAQAGMPGEAGTPSDAGTPGQAGMSGEAGAMSGGAPGTEPNLLSNGSFELGAATPDGWTNAAWQGTALRSWVADVASEGSHSALIVASTADDANWHQTVHGLVSGQIYKACGKLRGQDIVTTAQAMIGANIYVGASFTRSEALSGSFDWTEECVTFQSDGSDLDVGCRLGHFGSTVTGSLWCDELTLTLFSSG